MKSGGIYRLQFEIENFQNISQNELRVFVKIVWVSTTTNFTTYLQNVAIVVREDWLLTQKFQINIQHVIIFSKS